MLIFAISNWLVRAWKTAGWIGPAPRILDRERFVKNRVFGWFGRSPP